MLSFMEEGVTSHIDCEERERSSLVALIYHLVSQDSLQVSCYLTKAAEPLPPAAPDGGAGRGLGGGRAQGTQLRGAG